MMVGDCDDIPELQRAIPAADYLKNLLRQSSASLSQLNEAAVLRLRIMRQIGVKLLELNLRGGDRKSNSHAASLKLEDLNLKKDFACRCRRIASLDGSVFQTAIKNAVDSEHELTANFFYQLADAGRRKDSSSESNNPGQINPAPAIGDLTSVAGGSNSPGIDLRQLPRGYRLIGDEDFAELEGSIRMLSWLLSDRVVELLSIEIRGEAERLGSGS